MEYFIIKKGNKMTKVGGKLNCMALDYMVHPIIGTKDITLIEKTFNKLWRLKTNRFSHQYAFEAQINQKTVGVIICLPVSVINKLSWSTFQQVIKLRKWDLIGYWILHFKELYSLLSLKEGREDEYHIASLAILPEFRGYGIGSKLIHYAEDQAKLNQYNKCSLTVKKENKQALKLYKKLGYKIVNSIEKPSFSLYRMVKILTTS